MPNLPDVLKLIFEHRRFLIICHENPDGDAVGASLALRAGLVALNKEAVVVCRDVPPAYLGFLPDLNYLERDFLIGDFDVFFLIDCGDLARTGFAERISSIKRLAKPIINLDHHPSSDLARLATINLVDSSLAASAQIVAVLLERLDIAVTPSMATQLLVGLYTDTGRFRHSNTSTQVFKLAAFLLEKRAQMKKIVQATAPTRSLIALKLWGIVFSRIKKHPYLPLVTSVVTQNDLGQLGGTPDDLEGVVNFINSIPDTRAAVLFTELADDTIKVSVRTEDEGIDLTKFVRLFGGGGHNRAAGFRLPGKVVEDGRDWRIVGPRSILPTVST